MKVAVTAVRDWFHVDADRTKPVSPLKILGATTVLTSIVALAALTAYSFVEPTLARFKAVLLVSTVASITLVIGTIIYYVKHLPTKEQRAPNSTMSHSDQSPPKPTLEPKPMEPLPNPGSSAEIPPTPTSSKKTILEPTTYEPQPAPPDPENIPPQLPPVKPPPPPTVSEPIYPEPNSCRPQIAYIESPDDGCVIRRRWPQDLSILGITNEEKETIDRAVVEAARIRSQHNAPIVWAKKRICCQDNTGNLLFDAQLPISIALTPENHLLLFPKTVFGSGGERKIRWCYNATTGEFLLKKRVVGNEIEKTLIQTLIEDRKQRGWGGSVRSATWRSVKTRDGKNKLQVIEPVRDGTLQILFGTRPLQDFSVKYGLILDFLKDLHALHQINFTGSFKKDLFSPQISLEYKAFHQDIKIENTLVHKDAGGRWRGELSDFGAGSANPMTVPLSPGFTPPEYIRYLAKISPFGIEANRRFLDTDEMIQFNLKYAQGRDIWAMGLVILSVIIGKTEKATLRVPNKSGVAIIAPLQCLKKRLEARNYSPSRYEFYAERGILDLVQIKLDSELFDLEHEVRLQHPNDSLKVNSIFHVIRQMLKIDPEQRGNAASLLGQVEG